MADFIKITDGTIVQGVTSSQNYLISKINNRNIGIPAYTFSSTTPNIDLLPPNPSITLPDNTSFTSFATSYNVGMALSVNTSSVAVPLYKIIQDENDFPNLTFDNPFLVTNLTARNDYLIASIDDTNNTMFGLPLYDYGALYQATPASGIDLSAVPISTLIRIGKPLKDVSKNSGSTALNPKIQAYSDLVNRVKSLLGWPAINIDLCDENIATYIDQSIEMYTKYTGYTTEFLIFNTDIYKRGYGIKLDDLFTTACNPEMSTTLSKGATAGYDYDLKDYRKVIDCFSFEQGESTGINTLFTLEQAMAQQTYFSYMLGNAGFDLISWHVMKGWLELRSKVLAQTPYYRFDPRTQLFKILPEPYVNQQYYAVVGAYVERPIKDLISEAWVINYTLALTKIAIGHIRGKFGGQVLFGGGTLNSNDIMSQGIGEKKELEEQLYKGTGLVESEPAMFFLG